jgi:uncharacterized protein
MSTGAVERIAALPWETLAQELDAAGTATIGGLLSANECRELAALYTEERHFRSKVIMSRHGFGRGEYQYFNYPLPPLLADLRSRLYLHLAPIANHWNEQMGIATRYPLQHAQFLARCREAGQSRPTPLLLRYETGDYNCLHQDLYGEHCFPLQLTILLSRPDEDFTGAQFVLTEQRPRMQSRVEVVPLTQGDAVIFAVNQRPVKGARGMYRVKHRHGVSRLRSGRRYSAGLIFHDAK